MLYKLLWALFAFFAIGVGIYPLIYFMIDRHFGLLQHKSEVLLSDIIWNIAFYAHIIPGGIAMTVGWTQFMTRIRETRLHLHRTIGKIYVVSALVSGVAGFYIALYATGGIIAITGFAGLAVVWLYTTLSAYLAIRRRDTRRHEVMMIFSYALCFAAVTLRIWLPLFQISGLDFISSYQIVSWLCWVPNLLFAWWYSGRVRVGM